MLDKDDSLFVLGKTTQDRLIEKLVERKHLKHIYVKKLSKRQTFSDLIEVLVSENFVTTKALQRVLVDLCEEDFWFVRADVAATMHFNRRAFEALARDQTLAVRVALTANKCLTSKILEQLAHDKDEVVRYNVARHPKTSQRVLDVLSDEDHGASIHVRIQAQKTK